MVCFGFEPGPAEWCLMVAPDVRFVLARNEILVWRNLSFISEDNLYVNDC